MITKPKTIMFYINSIRGGGAERVIIQLAGFFSNIGHKSILITSFISKDEYPVPGNVERISIEEEEIKHSRIKKNISRIIRLREYCKVYNPDILVSFMAEPCLRAIISTIGLPVKNIISVRNDPNKEYSGTIGKIIGKIIIPLADGCVFQTEEAKVWFPKRLQKKSRVILNPVDKRFFEQTYQGGTEIVNLGRLSQQKNQEMLIKAFSLIADKHPEITLKIYGIGPLENHLKQTIRELGLESRVFLAGLTDKPEVVLSKAAAFVLSSDYEGMPNALMEALAVGVPCISTDCPCGGPKELIHDGINGLLVPVGDVGQLSAKMDILFSDESARKKLGRNAHKSAMSFHSDLVLNEWKVYIEDLFTV